METAQLIRAVSTEGRMRSRTASVVLTPCISRRSNGASASGFDFGNDEGLGADAGAGRYFETVSHWLQKSVSGAICG